MAGVYRVGLGSVGGARDEAAGSGPERDYNSCPQFVDCVRMVHLIRDVKFLTTLPDARDRAYGEGLREALRGPLRGDPPTGGSGRSEHSGGRLEAARDEVLRRGTHDVPATRASTNLAARLESHGGSYFRFITTPGFEPTNNLAEQAIRFVVIDRRITQGTRCERGDRWCERIGTVMATCSQQGRSVFAYLEAAVAAWFRRG